MSVLMTIGGALVASAASGASTLGVGIKGVEQLEGKVNGLMGAVALLGVVAPSEESRQVVKAALTPIEEELFLPEGTMVEPAMVMVGPMAGLAAKFMNCDS